MTWNFQNRHVSMPHCNFRRNFLILTMILILILIISSISKMEHCSLICSRLKTNLKLSVSKKSFICYGASHDELRHFNKNIMEKFLQLDQDSSHSNYLAVWNNQNYTKMSEHNHHWVSEISQMHSPVYRFTLFWKNIANAKIAGYHPDGKRKFPCKFQLSLRGETGREYAECDFEPFAI